MWQYVSYTQVSTMSYQEELLIFAENLRTLRKMHQLTQEQVAEALGKTSEFVSYLERGLRAPSFETIIDLTKLLQVTPSQLLLRNQGTASPKPEDIETVEAPVTTQHQHISDVDKLRLAWEGIQDLQKLASEYGITDVFQDNGGKVLQMLVLLGLKGSSGRA